MSASGPASFSHRPETVATLVRRLEAVAPGAVQTGVRLGTLTTLRIGGPVDVVCRVENADLARKFHADIASAGLPWDRLGGGSNVLGDDAGYPGVILVVATRDYEVHGDMVRVGAGLPFDAMITRTLGDGLVGLEFASGIPGSVGGAVVGNAGCYGHEIGEFVREARVLTPAGDLVRIGTEDFGFAYRTSALKTSGAIVLDVCLALRRGDAARAGETRDELIADRKRKHPNHEPTAGSWFKNLPSSTPGGRRQPAGALLEAVGAKAMREGDAAVFPRHANIVVNLGEATSADVLRLTTRMHDAVQTRFGIDLEPEVRHLHLPAAPTWLPSAD